MMPIKVNEKIKSTFALLDVGPGRARVNLDKNCDQGHYMSSPVEVVIKGKITHRHGSFDGHSQEFGVEVTSVEMVGDFCKHCGGLQSVHNPSGYCNHLKWPENLSEVAKIANGYKKVVRVEWEKEEING